MSCSTLWVWITSRRATTETTTSLLIRGTSRLWAVSILSVAHVHMRLISSITASMVFQYLVHPLEEYNTWNVRFDYRSVMLYGGGSESKRHMTTIDPRFQQIIGGAPTASPSDYHKVCSLYDCRQCIQLPFRRANGTCPAEWYDPHPLRKDMCATLPGDSGEFRGICCTGLRDYRKHPLPRCDSCIPEPECRGEWVATRPYTFYRKCCGACSPEKLQQWCDSLTDDDFDTWKGRGMCIAPRVRFNTTIRGTPVTTSVLCVEDFCKPKEWCYATPGLPNVNQTRIYQPDFFEHCCGACGEVWRWGWCEAMEASHEYSKWGLRGMCPVYAEESKIF